MNNFTVEIDEKANGTFVDYTKYAVFPLKTANFLDEQLDEMELELKHTATPYFYPLGIVKITFINNPEAKYNINAKNKIDNRRVDARIATGDGAYVFMYDTTSKRITEWLTRYFIIATDNAIEQKALKKNGVKKYDHKLYLIETTKIAEGFIGDPLTFTNVLGNTYADVDYSVNISKRTGTPTDNGDGTVTASWNIDKVIPVGSTIYYQDAKAIVSSYNSDTIVRLTYSATSAFANLSQGVTVSAIYLSAKTASIRKRGANYSVGDYVAAPFNTNKYIPIGTTVYYNSSHAEVIHYDASIPTITLKFTAGSDFASLPVNTGSYITVSY